MNRGRIGEIVERINMTERAAGRKGALALWSR
jgi:hypothetical protein